MVANMEVLLDGIKVALFENAESMFCR